MELAIRPGVAAVLKDGVGRVLLHRRRIGCGWAPPSGSLEPGESVAAGLARELQEETGLTARVERLVGLYSDPAFQVVDYPERGRVQFVTALFLCRRTGGTLAGNEEGTAWGWYSPDALPRDLTAYARVWLADALAPTAVPFVR